MAASTPRVMPMTVASSSATTASSIVAPRRPAMISATGWFWKIERPISPCNRAAK